MRKLFILPAIAIFASSGMIHAQTFYNNGAQIGVLTGAQMIIKTGAVANAGSLENASNGTFKNRGQVFIEGSFINSNGTADGFAANAGEYIVYQDWINNATFTADQSKVYLRGNNQSITGSSVTTFYDLICENPGTVKSQFLDANVSNTLTLNNNELATNNNTLTILNTNPNAIVLNGVNNSFVSSIGNGRLARNTNSTNEYLFPTGWNNAGTPLIREASVTPSDATFKSYSVRLGFNTLSNTSTTDDGYNVASKAATVDIANDKFYHLVSSNNQSAATLGLFFDPTLDGAWTSIGRWESAAQWEDLFNATTVNATPRSKVQKALWLDNGREPHALIIPKPLNKEFTFPNAFLPGATDPSIPIEDRVFTIIKNGSDVVLEELMVFNRWGEMVFNSKRDGTDTWDGYFQGVLQQQGNYSYLAKLRVAVTNEPLQPVKGNLALIW